MEDTSQKDFTFFIFLVFSFFVFVSYTNFFRPVSGVTKVSAKSEFVQEGFSRPLISLTFDDGYKSQFVYGVPLLEKYGYKGTFYLVSDFLNKDKYMTNSDVGSLMKNGHQIGSHSVSHAFQPGLKLEGLNYELSKSKEELSKSFSVPITDFNSPGGAFNDETINAISNYYRSNRTVIDGLNYLKDFDVYRIKVRNILGSTPILAVKSWVNEAKYQKAWLVLVYHDVKDSGDFFSVTPKNFEEQLAEIKKSNVYVVTLGQALDEILPQVDSTYQK